MSELVSMKISAAERKKSVEPAMVGGGEKDGPRYPYGLQLHLDTEVLDKLGLATLPTVGDAQILIARVEISGVSSHQGEDKKKRQSLSLQITDLCLEPEAQRKAIEEALYGDGKE